MKRTIAFLGAVIIALALGFSSCNSTDDALFVGTYKGVITYSNWNDGVEIKTPGEGTVTVTKVGDTYSFAFSEGIPDLVGVKFEKKDDNTHVSIGDGLTGITITDNKLKIMVVKDGKTWTANATRE